MLRRMFEKWYLVLLITFLPPLIPPYKGGKQENPVPSPMHRGGLGWGKKIFDTLIMTFQTSSKA
ncbi:hypothetical protein F8S20_34835 [Nostoc sp. BAE]|nr:hypothetical protein [Nostoc commune BAE]